MANNNNPRFIKMATGLQSAYNSISQKDANTLYFCTDSQRLFLGTEEYTRPITIGTQNPRETIITVPPYSLYFNNGTNGGVLYYNDGTNWYEIYNLTTITNHLNRRAEILRGVCDTAATTVVKDVDCPEFLAADFEIGTLMAITFKNTNQGAVANLKMTINGTSKAANNVGDPIKKHYNASVANLTAVGELRANETYLFAFDGTNWVCLTLDYYAENTNTYNLTELSYNYLTNGSTLPLGNYALFGFDRQNHAQGISTTTPTTNTTGLSTSRIYNTAGFDYTKGIWYSNLNSFLAINAAINTSPRYVQSAIDLRYTDNGYAANTTASPLGLVSRKAIYLRGVIKEDGLFYLAPMMVSHSNINYQKVWTQDIPTSIETDSNNYQYVYWMIGYPYYNSKYVASGYQLNLLAENKLYWFHNDRFEEYNSATGRLEHTLTIGTIQFDGSQDVSVPIYDGTIVNS